MDRAEFWYGKIANLRVDRARGEPAPHKPLLLMAVFDMRETGQLADPVLELTPELAFRFSVYGSVVAHRRSRTLFVGFPYYHLGSDGFWVPLDEGKQPTTDRKRARYAVVDPDLLEVSAHPEFRKRAMYLLIAKYFQPEDRAALYSLCKLAVPLEGELAEHADYRPFADARQKGREARFRVSVMYNYHFTCALTRYRLTTISCGSIVDAAHIHAHSSSQNNDPRNGLALCKNAHWLRDNGLWTQDDQYRVVVAREHFEEESPDPGVKGLLDFHGSLIHLPAEMAWPDLEYVGWHRRKRFRGYSD
jgi:putative restriction endonuclease